MGCRKRIAKPEGQARVFLAESEIRKTRGLRNRDNSAGTSPSLRRSAQHSDGELICLFQIGGEIRYGNSGGEPGGAVQNEQAGCWSGGRAGKPGQLGGNLPLIAKRWAGREIIIHKQSGIAGIRRLASG